MGRKPKAQNLNGKAPLMVEHSTPPLEWDSVKAELLKSTEALLTLIRLPKDKCLTVRRSSRLKSIHRPVQSREIQAVEEINFIESEEEIDEPHVDENTHEPQRDEKSLEEKVDYLIKVVEELKSKGSERHFSNETTLDNLNYRSLYFDSLKKIEALNSELYQCNKKLEFAQGKLEAYESLKGVMDKLKEVILISNLGKATETVVNLSSQLTSSCAPQTVTTTVLSPTKKKKCSNSD